MNQTPVKTVGNVNSLEMHFPVDAKTTPLEAQDVNTSKVGFGGKTAAILLQTIFNVVAGDVTFDSYSANSSRICDDSWFVQSL